MKQLLHIIAFCCLGVVLSAQTTHKEIKSFSASYPYTEGEKIIINGERTFITIKTWDKPEVQADIEVISRYTDKDQALKDLEKIKVFFEKDGQEILYSNAISIKKAKDKPISNLKTKLVLYIPEYSNIFIKNSFGELDLSGNIKSVRSDSKFCTSTIHDFDGDFTLYSSYGKVSIDRSSGTMDIRGSRTDMSMNEVESKLSQYLNYGNLQITYSDIGFDYDITVEYTPVTLLIPDNFATYHDIECNKCELIIDNCNSIKSENITNNKHEVTIGNQVNSKGKTVLKSKYENITVISITPQASTN